MVDLSLWLSPVDGENPSGESLRDDPRFQEIERLVEPQVTVVRDERNNPAAQVAVPVDWTAVVALADELRAKGRDLRLLVMLTRALANERQFGGLAEGLELIARSSDAFWETMHPELRAGLPPRDAALRRLSALAQLQDKQDGLLHDLRQAVFLAPRGVGPISGEDLEKSALDDRTMLNEAASGLNGSEKAALSAAHEQLLDRVRKGCLALIDQNRPEMARLTGEAQAAVAALDAVDAALNARTGGSGPAVPDLRRFVERALATLQRGAAAHAALNGAPETDAAPTVAAAAADGENAAADAPGGAAHGGNGAARVFFPERLSSRDDVIRCLDLVIAFYDRAEPSSPIPHLARRMRRMVPMDFVALLEDMAPSGLKEFRLLAGEADAKK